MIRSEKTVVWPGLASVLLLLALAAPGAGQDAETAKPAPPPVPGLSGNIPLAVANLPTTQITPEEARPYFDAFSWQEMMALNWPADTKTERGVPLDPNDPSVFEKAQAGGYLAVWITYKADFELFDQGDDRPTAWNDPKIPVDPCSGGDAGPTATFVRRGEWAVPTALVRVTKGDNLLQVEDEAFSYPLIDQNKNYVAYDVRFNEAQYNFVRGRDDNTSTWLYLVKNLAALERSPGGVVMPESRPGFEGAIMLKAAWKILVKGRDDFDRFYKINARILTPADPATKTPQKCETLPVGLVGFHIAQKLEIFPEWIWSTFEQVDNVPAGDPASDRRYSFFNPADKTPTQGGYAHRPPFRAPKLQPKNERQPVQVTRFNPIAKSTQATNAAWRAFLKEKKSVWQHYELVATQWPSNPSQFLTMEDGGVYPDDAGGAFPVNGVTNTVAETYFQSQSDAAGAGGNSCMSCHYRAGQADFSWTLMRGAH